MDYHFINSSAGPAVEPQKQMVDMVSQNRQPLPSPQEATAARSKGVGGLGRKSSSMLSAQTVTTTTVTTTTVTTFPPLRIPKVSRKRALAPEKYPLADVPMPPALENFAMDLNGQRMYFSQRDMSSCASGRDILASISANTVRSPEPMEHDDDVDSSVDIQRAITPLYTQDDTTTAVRRSLALATPASALSTSRNALAMNSLRAAGLDDRSRRSSSPQSPDTYRHFSRGTYSPSPPSRRMHHHQHSQHGGGADDASAPVSPVVSSEVLGSAENTAAAVAAVAASIATIAGGGGAEPFSSSSSQHIHNTSGRGGATPNDADDNMVALDNDAPPAVPAADAASGVLPLPSPLLSPRARPEFMDTDDMLDELDSSGGERQKPSRRQLRFPQHGVYRGKQSADTSEFSPPVSSRQSGAFDAHDHNRFSVRNSHNSNGSSHDVAHFFDGTLGYASNSEEGEDDDTEFASPNSLNYLQQEKEQQPGTKTTTHVVSRQHMPKEMTAMYDMPSIMATYDNLPPSMQTYLLHQLLRRTPRPALQFAAQTVLPVLHRDFIGDLPREVSHHVLKFMGTRELCRAACASRRWQDVVDGDRTVWRARLIDARYVEAAPRVHPLCHTYFGLAREEPERPVIAHRPTQAELDLSALGRRKETPAANALVLKATRKLLLPKDDDVAWRGPAPAQPNEFKDEFAHNYVLNRNWQTGKCRHFNFVCDSGLVVTCIQLTEKYIVAGFDTKNIFVFDINTGETVRRLVGHDGGVWALAIIGSTVVSGSTDRTVRVWDLETGRCTHVFSGHASTVRCLQILLPTDVRTPQERARNAPVRYEPKEPLIVTGSRDTTLKVWRLPSPARDEPHLPQAGAAASRAHHSHSHHAPPQSQEADDQGVSEGRMAVDQGADVASSSSDSGGTPRPSLPRTNQYFERTLEGHTDSVRAVAAYGNLVISGSYDCAIRVWDVTTGACLHRLEGHTAKVYTIVLDTDMHLIMSGSMDGTIRVWDWDSGVCLRICRGHLTLVGLLSLKHDTLISGGADTTLRIWDHPLKAAQRGNASALAQRPFSNISGDTVAVRRAGLPPPAPGSNLFAAQATMTAQQAGNLQQAHLMQQLQVQQRANDQIHHQQLLLLQQQHQQQQGSAGGRPVELADLVHTERHIMQQHTNAITCFQNDGIKMVSGADSTLKLWDARTGQFVRNLLSNLTSVWQVRFDKRRCVAAVNRNDVTYFEVMDFGA